MTLNQNFTIDRIINRLVQHSYSPNLQQADVRQVCITARQIILKQPMLLQLSAPIKICGDIHGQFIDLLKIFNTQGHPDKNPYLFIGDYVDRGKQSIQCLILLLAYKIKYPTQIYLLRGNHQCAKTTRIYGFYDECKRKYNCKIWKLFTDLFNVLPVCALIDRKIVCMHGGLSPELQNFSQISRISRPIQIPQKGLLRDLLWSDPEKSITGWDENYQRGTSYVFGTNVIDTFLKKHDLDLICRAHQVVEQGYEFFNNRKLVTLFSAPDYCGQFKNNGALMNVDQQLKCSFKIFQSPKKKKLIK